MINMVDLIQSDGKIWLVMRDDGMENKLYTDLCGGSWQMLKEIYVERYSDGEL